MQTFLTILCCILSYFLGCINAGYIYSKYFKHDDVRKYGSGNAGTTNVLRTYGIVPAACVLIIDALKGYAAVRLTFLIAGDTMSATFLSSFAVVAGHNWPITMGFRGGKGVATSLGVVIAFNLYIGLAAFGIALLVMLISRMASLGSLFGFVSATVLMFVYKQPTHFGITIGVLSVLTFIQHIANIKRIINGTEKKIGQKSDNDK